MKLIDIPQLARHLLRAVTSGGIPTEQSTGSYQPVDASGASLKNVEPNLAKKVMRYKYPTDIIEPLRAEWYEWRRREGDIPELPTDEQLQALLEIAYHASFTADEQRRTHFDLVLCEATQAHNPFRFSSPRDLTPHEIMRLNQRSRFSNNTIFAADHGTCAGESAPNIAFEVLAGIIEEVGHCLTAVIASDIGVEVLPDALDAVGVWTIGRQEVKHDAVVERLEDALSRLGRVDAVVVDNEVNAAHRGAVPPVHELQQLTEQPRVFALGARRVQQPCADVERAGEVEFLVLARRDDAALLAGKHPIAPESRVEMDVDFIGVEHGFFGARALLLLADLGEPTFAHVALPWTEHDGFGHSAPRSKPGQYTTHRANGDHRPALLLHLQTQQLAGPRRSRPTEMLRRALQKLCDPAAKGCVRFGSAVVAPPVVQAFDPIDREAMRRAHHRRRRDVQLLRHLGAALAQTEAGDDVKAQRRRKIVALSAEVKQISSLCAVHLRYDVHAWVFLVGFLANSQNRGRPTLISIKLRIDRDSCSVI